MFRCMHDDMHLRKYTEANFQENATHIRKAVDVLLSIWRSVFFSIGAHDASVLLVILRDAQQVLATTAVSSDPCLFSAVGLFSGME